MIEHKNNQHDNYGVALIIHAKSAILRENNVKRLKKSLFDMSLNQNMEIYDIEAIDAGDLSVKEQKAFCDKVHKPHFPFEISQYEIACFLSHRKAWSYIVDCNFEYGLIFEDDAKIIEENFKERIKNLVMSWKIIK